MSSLRKALFSGRGKSLRAGPADFTPIKWSKYFESHEHVSLEDGKFHYYKRGSVGPLLVAIHGGGYSALTWALFSQEVTTKIECQVLAIDLRGHGNTSTDNDFELSLTQLSMDVRNMIFKIYNDDIPPIVLIGHSLGGAVAVEVAPMIPSLIGLCVIDVVEGTALESLSTMQSILRARPSGFKTILHAVQWGFRGGSTQNLEAAKISMPGQIKNTKTNILASEEVELNHPISSVPSEESGKFSPQLVDPIMEENEDIQDTPTTPPSAMKPPLPTQSSSFIPKPEVHDYIWRIDLTKTEQYWTGWFKGLSQKFLNVNAPKILILANIYGMDTSLTIGQMQGKFQLQVLSRSGHAIHEDQPEQVADILATYLVRQKLAVALQGFVPMLPGC